MNHWTSYKKKNVAVLARNMSDCCVVLFVQRENREESKDRKAERKEDSLTNKQTGREREGREGMTKFRKRWESSIGGADGKKKTHQKTEKKRTDRHRQMPGSEEKAGADWGSNPKTWQEYTVTCTYLTRMHCSLTCNIRTDFFGCNFH